jgi:hypothetical protein
MPIEPARAAARSERMSAWTGICQLWAAENPCQWRDLQELTIRGNNNVHALWLVHHPDRHCIDKHLVMLNDSLVLLGDVVKHLVPQHHTVPLGIALRHHGQLLPRPRLSRLERKSHDSLNSNISEDSHFSGNSILLMAMRSASLARILALRVLSHDYPIEQLRILLALFKRALRARQNPRRPHIYKLVELFSNRQDHIPQ